MINIVIPVMDILNILVKLVLKEITCGGKETNYVKIHVLMVYMVQDGLESI